MLKPRIPSFVLLIILVIIILAPSPSSCHCLTDSECQSENPYCINSTCTFVIPTGRYCARHQDCASFIYLPFSACSGACGIEAQCAKSTNPLQPKLSSSCCLPVPENMACLASRETSTFNVCDEENGFKCLINEDVEGKAVCRMPQSQAWVFGVALAIGGSVVQNVGLNLQKKAYLKSQRSEIVPRKPLYKSWIWLIGFFYFVAGNLCNFGALSFAAQSLVAPLGGAALVTNAIAAPIINKEPITPKDLVAIGFIIIGSVIVVVFSNRSEAQFSLCALISFYSRTAVIILLTLLLSLIFSIFLFIRILEANTNKVAEDEFSHANSQSRKLAATSFINIPPIPRRHDSLTVRHDREEAEAHEDDVGLPDKTYCRSIRLIWRKFKRFRSRNFFSFKNLNFSENSVAVRYMLPLAYASIGGIMGALTILFAKSSVELVTLSIIGENQFVYPATYFIILSLLVFAVGQVVYINAGLARYDAMLQVPVYYVVYTIMSVVAGGVYFDEFKQFSTMQYGLFYLGISLTFIGVAILATRLKKSNMSTRNDDKTGCEKEAGKGVVVVVAGGDVVANGSDAVAEGGVMVNNILESREKGLGD